MIERQQYDESLVQWLLKVGQYCHKEYGVYPRAIYVSPGEYQRLLPIEAMKFLEVQSGELAATSEPRCFPDISTRVTTVEIFPGQPADMWQQALLPTPREGEVWCILDAKEGYFSVAAYSREDFQRKVPAFYVPPLNTPLYWGNEQSGMMRDAVAAYYNGAMSGSQVELLREYLIYYINAPCWQVAEEEQEKFKKLKQEATTLTTVEQFNHWLYECLVSFGLDPL
jgi:hypothetical protein